MSEYLSVRVNQLKDALARLQEALVLPPLQINKDGSIQRFEFTFELVWKILKTAAYYKGLEVASPRDSIRTAASLGLINNVDLWFDFLDARNLSTHVYNEKIANEIYQQLPKFVTETDKLVLKLQNLWASDGNS